MPSQLPNVTDSWTDLGDDVTIPQAAPTMELGVTGLKRIGGYVEEEFLPALRGRKAVRIFREMSMNDSMVGALLFTIDKLVREVEWKVTPASQSQQDLQAAEFLKTCMDDMSHTWNDFIGEVLSMIVYGWSWHEIVYKKRVGPWEDDPAKRSKYTDGMFGWRKLPIRAQETMFRWVFDDKGGIKGLIQMPPPAYTQIALPIEKSLLFRTSISKGNPEGMSLLRNAYRSWFFKKRLEEFEAIGVERDLAGMPVARVPAEYLTAKAGTAQAKTVDAFRKMVRGVRRDENEGLILPSAFDQDTKQQLFEFELMSAGGSRAFDTNALIQRYEQRILMSVLADFILVGHEDGGSYALHTDKTGIFRASLNAITKSIAETLNRHAVPRLFALNAMKLDSLPTFEPSDIDPPDLTQLAQFITATAGAGMQWFPDPQLEAFLRDIARLPEQPVEEQSVKTEMYRQQQAMDFANSQSMTMGAQQKAYMVSQGHSPEQAEAYSQQPTSEMAAQQATAQQDGQQAALQHPMGQYQEQQAQQQAEMQAFGNAAQTEAQTNQIGAQDAAGANQHKRDLERMTQEEKLKRAEFQREKQRTQWSRKDAERAHTRDSQKAKLSDTMARRQHSRSIKEMREKTKAEAAKARFTRKPDKDRKNGNGRGKR